MKFKERKKTIDLPALSREIKIVLTNDILKSRNKRSKKLGKLNRKLGKYVDGLCCEKEYNLYLFISNKATLGVISHEAYHAVCSIFRYIGVQDYDEELVAYHLGYIVDKIIKIKKL